MRKGGGAPALASCRWFDCLASLKHRTEAAWQLETVAKLRVSPHLVRVGEWGSAIKLLMNMLIVLMLNVGQDKIDNCRQ